MTYQRPHIGDDERTQLVDGFDSTRAGTEVQHVEELEREFAAYVGAPYAVALSSGSAALQLALQVLGVGRGGDVLTSTMTCAATANAITAVGAMPAFVDVSRETWNLDPDLLEQELEARSRGRQAAAVVSVDLYGQCADYARITGICTRFGVPLLEDAAGALGATYGRSAAGTFGECAALSFGGNRIITTGGGMLVSHRRDIVDRARHLATQARDPVAHCQHSELGCHGRHSNLLAAIGRDRLRSLPARLARRREVNDAYRAALAQLPGLHFMPEAAYGRSNCRPTCVTVDPSAGGASREDLRLALESENIEARLLWKPMHLQPAFSACSMAGGAVAEDLFDRGLCLPSGSSLAAADQARVIDIVRSRQMFALHLEPAAATARSTAVFSGPRAIDTALAREAFNEVLRLAALPGPVEGPGSLAGQVDHTSTIGSRFTRVQDALRTVMLGGTRIPRMIYVGLVERKRDKPILLFGAEDAGQLRVRTVKEDRQVQDHPVAFVDDDPAKVGQRTHGVRVAATGRVARRASTAGELTAGQFCPRCASSRLARSHSHSLAERARKQVTAQRLYRCEACSWRGWLLPPPEAEAPVEPLAAPDLSPLDVAVAPQVMKHRARFSPRDLA